MPVYDRVCDSCGWTTDFAFEPVTDPHPQCPECKSSETRRYMAGHGPMVIPDTFSTPVVDSVMTKHTQIHYSRSERKARMKHNRLQEFERWVPGAESDKSCWCPRWGVTSADALDKWKAYFLDRYPLTADEQLVLTDRERDTAVANVDSASETSVIATDEQPGEFIRLEPYVPPSRPAPELDEFGNEKEQLC